MFVLSILCHNLLTFVGYELIESRYETSQPGDESSGWVRNDW